MRRVTTVVIGAGQSGLAMSHYLSAMSVDHVVLERGRVANSWRTERWNSLRLLTPNWHSRLPSHAYSGSDPDGFRTLQETIHMLETYAGKIAAPVVPETTVLEAGSHDGGYRVATDQGDWLCRTLVIASGAMNLPCIPAFAAGRSRFRCVTANRYRSPCDIEAGGVLVVGASSSGVQIARELQLAGRQVTLAVGEHVRVPRTYRGRDIIWLMDAAGMFDDTIDDVDDLERVRSLPSMQLTGSPSRMTIDLNSLQSIGIRIVGRLVDLDGAQAQFSGSLANVCRLADLKMNRLLRHLDEWIDCSDLRGVLDAVSPFRPTCIPALPPLRLNLADERIGTVVWATGFRPDYSWLKLPVFDDRRRLRHQGGVVDMPGIYVLGLPFLRRRKSNLIDGVGDDARDLSAHLGAFLSSRNSLVA